MAKGFHRLLAALLCLMLNTAWAGSSSSLQMHILVLGGCNFVTWGDLLMDFGTLGSGDQTITAIAPISCSNGTQFTVTLDQGLHANGTQRQMGQQGGSGRLPYTLTASPSSGLSNGQNINIELLARVRQSDYQAVPVGQYSDTVILRVDP